MTCRLPLVILVLVVGCNDSTGSARDPDARAPLAADAPDELSADDASTEASAELGPAPVATPLPLASDQVQIVGQPGGLDVSSALARVDGRPALIYEHFDAAFTTGELRWIRADDQGEFGAPRALLSGDAPYVASPTAITADDRPLLYAVQATDTASPATMLRWQLSALSAQPRAVTAPQLGLLSWPKFYALAGGRVAMAYRDALGVPRLSISSDGLTFGQGASVSNVGVAMPALGVFGDGTLAFTYQTQGTARPMTSWVCRSSDGQSWSAPARVTEASGNVHDTTMARRSDGDLDLYYSYPVGGAGFALFRRPLAADGMLGAEQQVTAIDVGEVTKPSVGRLADGTLLLSFAVITARDPQQGWPTEQRLGLAKIHGDAPR